MAVRRRRRWGGLAVPVFAAAGADAWPAVQELRCDPGVRLVASPRHASALLVAGTIPDEHRTALERVHDQIPHPRAVVTWRASGAVTNMPVADVSGTAHDVTAGIRDAYVAVLDDPAATAEDLLADREPNEWRGVGPYGQGGEGMMGGTPYGRPMAMTGDDRDGLELDELKLTLGPFLDPLPAGLVIEVALQGEVLTSVAVRSLPSPEQGGPRPFADDGSSMHAGARGGLRWLSHALHTQGLDAIAVRTARLARALGDGIDGAAVAGGFRQVERWVRRSGVLRALHGVGDVHGTLPQQAQHLRGDAADRWRRQLVAIGDALDEGVRQPSRAVVAVDHGGELLEEALVGTTLTDAIRTIVSLGLLAPPSRQAAAA